MFPECLLLGFVAAVIWFVWDFFRHPSGTSPPCPQRLPFFGNLLSFRSNLEAKLTKLSKDNDWDVFMIQMGEFPLYVTSGPEGTADAMKGSFYERPPSELLRAWVKGDMFGFQHHSKWQYHRKLAHASFLAYNKMKTNKPVIESELAHLLDHLTNKADRGESVVAFDAFSWCTVNITVQILMGMRFETPEHEDFIALRRAYSVFVKWAGGFRITDFITFLNRFLNLDTTELSDAGKLRDRVMRSTFDEHLKYFETNGEPRDYIDLVLRDRQKHIDANQFDELPYYLHHESIYASQVDNLLLAGMDTVALTLDWATIFLINNPDVQQKLYEEIKEVCGDRPPKFEDKPQLKYMDAVLHEIWRLRSCVLLGKFTNKPAKLGKFKIPGGSTVFVNLLRLHRHEKYWENPVTFDPERWYSRSEGAINEKNHLYYPFGGGPRQCVGIALAHQEAYTIFANIVYHFTFHSTDGKPVTEDEVIGLLTHSKMTPILVKCR